MHKRLRLEEWRVQGLYEAVEDRKGRAMKDFKHKEEIAGAPSVDPTETYTSRIVNGQVAKPGSWPWQVSLQDYYGRHFCGGSLITQNWVITAAHCNFNPGYHHVVLGEFDMYSSAEPVQIKSVSQVITHPYWNPYNMNYDCTLLRLSSPAGISNYVSPIRLVTANAYIPEGTTCITTGWGRTVPGGSIATKLMQTNIPIIDPQTCRQYWGNQISDIMICAGASGSSSCQGDSGGPLVCYGNTGWNLVGIVSWGTVNCNTYSPAVYARVSKLRSFVDRYINY
ncbi:chymotrypsin-like protease CTRL-1 [Mustelus asterias]